MIGIARSPGTCGELVQGTINGMNFLVTCPVNVYSEVKVELNNSGEIITGGDLPKVKQAVKKTLEFMDAAKLGATIQVSSDIPMGKGMASSTADIVAACAAVSLALGSCLSASELAGIALGIEPTDGLMFNGITMFDHVEGQLHRYLGHAPRLEIVIVDLGGTVDTVAFNVNKNLENLNRQKEPQVASALVKLEEALLKNDSFKIGEAATESAFANQKILYKQELQQLLDLCKCNGGVGINVAHSGTVVGLMFEAGECNLNKVSNILSSHGFITLFNSRMVNGGVQVLREGSGDKTWQPLNTFMGETSERQKKSTG